MSRHLPRRILASAIVSVLLAVVLIVIGLNLMRPTIQWAAVANSIAVADLDACAADPASWGWRSGELSFFAYDRGGRSANPSAPALEPELLEAALAGGIADRASAELRVSLVQGVPGGACALVRVASGNAETAIQPRFMLVLGTALLAGMVLAGIGTLGLVVLPYRARVHSLAEAASAVGGDTFEPRPAEPDALGHIAAVLARSHARLVEARDALEARNRALEDHLAGIAHDLRTPLASMQLALEGVAAGSSGALQSEARQALADGVYLTALVENLHHAARLRHAVDVRAGEVDLAELVLRLERRFAIVGRHANVAVAAHTPDEPVWAACTPALAERAVANLIQNAVEHNPGPGHVAVTLAVVAGRFELVVTDDGPGLPESTLASLDAETFLTDDARQRGPGLGMLITAEVARRASWTLSYALLEPTGLRVRIEGALSG